MQKLVTIYLNEKVDEHRTVHEHLSDYLAVGWRIVSVTPTGFVGEHGDTARGWVVVILEKPGTSRPSV